jgi:hypothetical protein
VLEICGWAITASVPRPALWDQLNCRARIQRLNEPAQADWLGFREERRPEQDEK